MMIRYACMVCGKSLSEDEACEVVVNGTTTYWVCNPHMSQAEAMEELVRLTEEMGLYDREEE